MMPKQRDMEIPLLKCIDEIGGRGQAKDIYPLVSRSFPNFTKADLDERLSSGGNKWKNRIQWVRQTLVSKGEISSPEYGIWAITEKGVHRLKRETVTLVNQVTEKFSEVDSPVESAPNFEEVVEEYGAAFEDKILQKLLDLSPGQFENFSKTLLAGYGFLDVEVTGSTNDGGIDGYGKLRVGLASMNVAFQCKRWQSQVSRPEIDKFRGAIQGEYEQGIFFTTSDFTTQAQDASIKKGTVPIVMLNGRAIVRLMIGKGIGIRRRPVEIYEDDIDALFEENNQ